MGIRTLVRGAMALAVVVTTLLLAAPGRGAGLSDTGCTHSRVGDACSGTAFGLEATSVTLTLTADNVYPACAGGQRNGCLYQYFIRPLASGYNNPAAGSGTCNGTAVGSVAYLPASGPLTCTITYSWTGQDGSAYPTSLTVQVLELDGDALDSGPQNAHGFTTTRGVPAPVAAFTYTRGAGPREFVFTAAGTSRLGGLHNSWDFGDGTYGNGATVTHTFPHAGTFDVE